MLHWEPLSGLQFVEFLKKTRSLQLNREENDLVLMINGAQCYADPMSHTLRVNAGARSFILAFKNRRGRPGMMSTFTGGQEGGGRREGAFSYKVYHGYRCFQVY